MVIQPRDSNPPFNMNDCNKSYSHSKSCCSSLDAFVYVGTSNIQITHKHLNQTSKISMF